MVPRINNNWLRLSMGLTLLSLALVACGTPAAAVQPDPLALTLHAQDIKFDVASLSAQVGQPVTLTYINQGLIDHAFMMDNYVDEQTVSPGQTTTFSFTPTAAGTFRFYCAIPGHEAAGMVGSFTVSP
jgi:plastocyanin